MQNIVIFNGFETVKFPAKVFEKRICPKPTDPFQSVVKGIVVFRGEIVEVEDMGEGEWWGRTT